MNLKTMAIGAAVSLIAATAAQAANTLDFEGGTHEASINHFYNGGTDDQGAAGQNFGVTVTGAVFQNDADAYEITDQPSGIGIMRSDGAYSIFNLIDGFSSEFSFNYLSSEAAFAEENVVVGIYDGLDGNGSLLTSLTLSRHGCQYNEVEATSCDWTFETMRFSGLAKSVYFTMNNSNLALDDVTFGAAATGAVPEPSVWAMMIAGFGLAGATLRRRRQIPVLSA